MASSLWTGTTWIALLVTFAYAIVFAGIGMKWFHWSEKN